jgi:hypothetical protein
MPIQVSQKRVDARQFTFDYVDSPTRRIFPTIFLSSHVLKDVAVGSAPGVVIDRYLVPVRAKM